MSDDIEDSEDEFGSSLDEMLEDLQGSKPIKGKSKGISQRGEGDSLDYDDLDALVELHTSSKQSNTQKTLNSGKFKRKLEGKNRNPSSQNRKFPLRNEDLPKIKELNHEH